MDATWRGAALALLLILLMAILGPFASPVRAETIVFGPDRRASWGLRNMFAFLRPSHNYGARQIVVETSPPGAVLDLFYVRSNFQKGYEQTEAPVTIELPTRMEAGPRDSITIRAYREGFRQREVSVKIASTQSLVLIEMEPLPNTLHSISHTYFGGRGSLNFLTDEPLAARVQKKDAGFNVILAETARGPEIESALKGVASPLVQELAAIQLGEDLLVQVHLQEFARGTTQLRSRQGRDPIRDLYTYQVDLLPKDGARAVEQAHEALSGIRTADVSGCALRFDERMRGSLDEAELARALVPKGSFTDPYLRAAMRRLGELSPGGVVKLLDGTPYRTSAPIELAAALSQGSHARGFLALLRRFVTLLDGAEHRVESLRSLTAPEMPPGEFASAFQAAEAFERACH